MNNHRQAEELSESKGLAAGDIEAQGQAGAEHAIRVNGHAIVCSGRLLRVASIQDETWSDNEIGTPDLFLERLRMPHHNELRADAFTFTQMVPDSTTRHPFNVQRESVAAVPIRDFDSWWTQLPQVTRKNVRRARKRGVAISVQPFGDEVIRGIVSINNDSPLRQGRKYNHFGKTHDEVKADQASFLDRSEFICAHAGAEMIGYVKLVYRGRIASILNLTPKASHADKRPANALLAAAVERCARNGVEYLTYGMLYYGRKGADSMTEFKIRNGFEEFSMPRYFVPLNRWGAIGLRLGLHKQFVELAPAAVVRVGRWSRREWLNVRYGTSK